MGILKKNIITSDNRNKVTVFPNPLKHVVLVHNSNLTEATLYIVSTTYASKEKSEHQSL